MLGTVEILAEDGTLQLAGKHARLLAALVVADGRACGVDELVEAVWNGRPPVSARKLLQIYVSQLRKILPPEIEVTTQPGAYAIGLSPETLDATRFERLLGESIDAREAGNPALALSLAERARCHSGAAGRTAISRTTSSHTPRASCSRSSGSWRSRSGSLRDSLAERMQTT